MPSFLACLLAPLVPLAVPFVWLWRTWELLPWWLQTAVFVSVLGAIFG